MIHRAYVQMGRFVGWLALPLMRLLIRRTSRAYVIVRCQGKILLVKNWLDISGKWALPGGGVARGESPAEAAVRETGEELGIKLHVARLKLTLDGRWHSGGLRHRYYIYSTSIARQQPIKRERLEITSADWVPVSKLRPDMVSAEIWRALNG